jgi:hypothetical protein
VTAPFRGAEDGWVAASVTAPVLGDLVEIYDELSHQRLIVEWTRIWFIVNALSGYLWWRPTGIERMKQEALSRAGLD